ncbi:lef-11 [Spodoptera litura granulovirus]|uniref:Late expression factor 11 n=1 Tax=Spodoptera litura granulovirus TaxID=359919 RepID=A5IZQ1_9BBAC|nr:lef-11 [Spodoptera litura granulovirus]ABQ51992.1 lef-11 [Spodoptera litura granulovirus]
MILSKSHLYSILREVINYKKHNFDTEDVVAHVEEAAFEELFAYILRCADKIFILQPDLYESIAPHKNRIRHLLKLPKTLQEEYLYCDARLCANRSDVV